MSQSNTDLTTRIKIWPSFSSMPKKSSQKSLFQTLRAPQALKRMRIYNSKMEMRTLKTMTRSLSLSLKMMIKSQNQSHNLSQKTMLLRPQPLSSAKMRTRNKKTTTKKTKKMMMLKMLTKKNQRASVMIRTLVIMRMTL